MASISALSPSTGSSYDYGNADYADSGSSVDGTSGTGGTDSLEQLIQDLKSGKLSNDDIQFLEQLLSALIGDDSSDSSGGGAPASEGGAGSAVSGGGGGGGYSAPASGSYSAPAATQTNSTTSPVVDNVQSKAVAPQTSASGSTGTDDSTASSATNAATETSSSTSASTTSGGGSDFSGGKEGLGVSSTSANGDGQNMGDSSWYYDWSPVANSNVSNNAKFVPMIHDQSQMTQQDLDAVKNSSSDMALTFNEPELSNQANMTVDQAISDWPALESTGKKLSSPAITNDPAGQQWLSDFMNQAQQKGLKVDSIALHWYGDSSAGATQNVQSLKSFIQNIHEQYPNMPIDLTEFGLDNGQTQDPAFLSQAEDMLNSLNYVQMYAPYGLGTPQGNG